MSVYDLNIPNSTNLRFDRPQGKKQSRGSLLIIIALAGSVFASFLSPQVGQLGRGLRFALPAFGLLCAAVWLFRQRNIRLQLKGFILPTIFALLFVAMAGLRYLFDPQSDLFASQVYSVIVCLGLWGTVILVRKVIPRALEGVRWVVLIILGLSLGAGIPILIQNPGIARTTMGNPLAAINAALLAPKGISNYAIYIPVGLAFPVVASWLYNSKTRWLPKLFGWSMLMAAAAATLFSTFMAAILLLVIGILIWLILVVLSGGRKNVRWIIGIILLVVVISFPTLYTISLRSQSISYATEKANRIIITTFTRGALAGDETGRVKMFTNTMETFFQEPIFGSWGLVTNFYIGGHSSWADTLALHGIAGLFLWLGFLMPAWRRGSRPLSIIGGAAGGTIAWSLLALGGILDPTFFSQAGLLLLWLFDEGEFWKRSQTTSTV